MEASGLIPQTNNPENHSNGFLTDSELGGTRINETNSSYLTLLFFFPESVVYSDYLTGKTMADFVGINGLEKNIVEAIMNFSYHLTLGDLDAAFKAIKIIKKFEKQFSSKKIIRFFMYIHLFRESVWENLARMCVLNRRADVAKICLGRMGLSRGARALRAVDQDNSDTKIAILAIHLNMKVCLIQSCQARINFDLTAALIQAKVVPRGMTNINFPTSKHQG